MISREILLPIVVIFSTLLPNPVYSLTEDEFFDQIPPMDAQGPFNGSIPALYIFGDSLVDSGNNMFLKTIAKADAPPYGIDFHGKPTGRFTNGRTVADFLAQLVGLPFPPPILGSRNETILTGMNYASASCGILPTTRANANSMCLCLDAQIDFFENTTRRSLQLSFNDEKKLSQHLERSLVYINMGSNDFALTYFGNKTLQSEMGPPCFSRHIADHLSMALKRLYNLGIRKFLVSNAGSLGCTPMLRNASHVTVGCVKPVNDAVSTYDTLLPHLLSGLQGELPGTTFVLLDGNKLGLKILGRPDKYGLKNVADSCVLQFGDDSSLCENRDEYFFFDSAHPTQKIHFNTLKGCFYSSHYCYPLTLKQLLCPCTGYSYLHTRIF